MFSTSNFSLHRITQYKDIIWYRTWAHLKSESKQYYLGYIWFLLEPFLASIILYFVFGVLLNNRTTDFVFFLIFGLTVWQWIESSTQEGIQAIVIKLHILNTIPLPKFLFPIVHIMASTVKFVFVYLVITLLSAYFGLYPSFHTLLFPLLLFITWVLIIGISLPIAVFNAYFPDTARVVQALFRILFYLSGIFFSAEKLPTHLKTYFYLNPFASLIEAFRDISLYQRIPNISHLIYVFIIGAITCCIGFSYCLYIDKKLLKSVH